MKQLVPLIALIGFILSLVVHLLAIFGFDVLGRFPEAWLLHVGIFAVAIPMGIECKKEFGHKPKFRDTLAILPGWVQVIEIALTVYALLNFVIFVMGAEGGNPSFNNGIYSLEVHGKFVRELTEEQYHLMKANTARGFSGHWLIFYFSPIAYFWLRKKSSEIVDRNRE